MNSCLLVGSSHPRHGALVLVRGLQRFKNRTFLFVGAAIAKKIATRTTSTSTNDKRPVMFSEATKTVIVIVGHAEDGAPSL